MNLHFFRVSCWKIIVLLLWCTCFLHFSCSFKSCIVVFAFKETVTSSSLYWLVLGEKYLLSALLEILRLSQTFLWICLLYNSCSIIGEGVSEDCTPSLDPAKTGCVLTVSHLLSLGQWWILKFVCFLRIPQSWAGFLYLLTSHLQNLALTALHGKSRELTMGGDVYGWSAWSAGGAHGPVWRIPRWGAPSNRGQASTWLVGSESLWCPLRALVAILSTVPHPQVMKYTSVFWMRWEKVGLFGGIPHSWGSRVLTHKLSLFLCGRDPGWESLLALSYAALGEGWCG